MESRRGLAAVLLLSAAAASAQVEVRPVLAAPAARAPLALAAPAAALTPSLSAVPAPPAAPLTAAPALAAPVAAPAAVAAPSASAAPIAEALADFGRVDMAQASPAAASASGETLMARALGAAEAPAAVSAGPDLASAETAPSAAPAGPPLARSAPGVPPSGRRLYLLSKPLKETVKLGPLSILAHVGATVAWEFGKAWAAWRAGGWGAAVGVTVVELPAAPLMATARSLAHLGALYWWRKLRVLHELARVPGVERIRVLTTGDVKFTGPIARRKDNTGLLFVEASSELPESVGRYGAAIPIDDPAAVHMRLTLIRPDGGKAASWKPSLATILEGRPIPENVTASWRGSLAEAKSLAAPMDRLSDLTRERAVRIEAVLIGADGAETPLPPIVEGPPTHALIGLGFWDRARAYLGRSRAQRALPVSDSEVARAGAPREPGLRALLSRAWRRLSGRLIVAP